MTLRTITLCLLQLASTAYSADDQLSRQERRAAQALYWNAGDEPPSMDPTKQADSVSGFWLGHIYEGLTRTDAQGVLVGGAAESFTHTPDFKQWTFKLRKNGTWHDGKQVTAHDFVYAWQRLVNPDYASEYSFIAISAGLANATEIIERKKPVTDLGVSAIDDFTLQVSLTNPVPYFASLSSFQVFFPVRKDVVDAYGPLFATSAASIIGNGPFRLANWQRESSMRIVKSDSYWNRDQIKLKMISSPQMVKDSQGNFNNFLTGGIDFTGASSPEIIKQAQIAKYKIETFPTGCVSYLDLNVRAGRVFSDKLLRQELQAGVNMREYINKIIGIPGYKPATGIVPDYLPGSVPGRTYRGEVGAMPQAKKQANDSSKKRQGTITILAGDSGRAKKIAEYWQNRIAKILPYDILVSSVPFKTRLQKTRDGDFDLSLSGWCPDYNDPMTFMDLFTSFNDNNHTGWKHAEYDRLVLQAGTAKTLSERVKLFQEAETLLYAEAPIIPIEQSGGAYMVAPGLKGVRRQIFGADPDFRYAYWETP